MMREIKDYKLYYNLSNTQNLTQIQPPKKNWKIFSENVRVLLDMFRLRDHWIWLTQFTQTYHNLKHL